jgi:hypothetical protein
MSNPQPLNIAAVAPDLPGQHVVLADGDELGVITDVVQTSVAANGVPAHAIVVEVDDAMPDTLADPLLISAASVLTVTNDAVVLGTTARWLDQHTVAEPKRG